jgi:hypothetical protein
LSLAGHATASLKGCATMCSAHSKDLIDPSDQTD